MSKINVFLDTLNAVAEKNAFEVYIPSLKRTVKFKPITAKQQKSFYSCVRDNILFETQFIKTTYEIIKENCLEQDIIDSFNIIDRVSILLNLRKNILGTAIAVVKDEVLYNLDFAECLERLQRIETPSNKNITTQDIQVEFEVPTITEQYKAEIELRQNSNTDSFTYNEAVVELVTSEVCKIIKSVSITKDGQVLKLYYKNLSFEERITLTNNLPAEIFIELQKYIKEINTAYDSLLLIKVDENTTVSFDISPDLFLSE